MEVAKAEILTTALLDTFGFRAAMALGDAVLARPAAGDGEPNPDAFSRACGAAMVAVNGALGCGAVETPGNKSAVRRAVATLAGQALAVLE